MCKAVVQSMQDTMEHLFLQAVIMRLQEVDIEAAVIECLTHSIIQHLPKRCNRIQFIIIVNRDGTMDRIKVRLSVEPAFRLGCRDTSFPARSHLPA